MKDFNTKIEELNKEYNEIHKETESCEECKDSLIKISFCDFHSDELDRIIAKIDMLKELRAEAIEEVKNFIKQGENYPHRIQIANYLRRIWNITDLEERYNIKLSDILQDKNGNVHLIFKTNKKIR